MNAIPSACHSEDGYVAVQTAQLECVTSWDNVPALSPLAAVSQTGDNEMSGNRSVAMDVECALSLSEQLAHGFCIPQHCLSALHDLTLQHDATLRANGFPEVGSEASSCDSDPRSYSSFARL